MKNGINYTIERVAITIWILGAVLFPCIILAATGTANLSIKCFAADSTGNLYVGISKRILVYSDETVIRTISVPTSRDYVFTISNEDVISLYTPTRCYEIDLMGNVLKASEDNSGETFRQMRYRRRKFVAPNGDNYKLKDSFGWTRIEKDGITVYRISLLSFLVKIVIYLVALYFAIFVVRVIIQETVRRTGEGSVS